MKNGFSKHENWKAQTENGKILKLNSVYTNDWFYMYITWLKIDAKELFIQTSSMGLLIQIFFAWLD